MKENNRWTLNVRANTEKAGCRYDMEKYKKNIIKYGLVMFFSIVATLAFAKKNEKICWLGLPLISFAAYKIIINGDNYWRRRTLLKKIEKAQGK